MVVVLPARSDGSGIVPTMPDGFAFDAGRQWKALQEVQFWNWGQDIRRTEGNLLIGYGFERRKPPAGQVGSSAYRLELAGGVRIDLWGFGILCRLPPGQGRAIYLARTCETPALIDTDLIPDHVWEPEQVTPTLARDGAARADPWPRLALLCQWIAAYERWVAETAGVAYRRHCLAGRRRMVVPVEHLALAWQAAAAWAAHVATSGSE